MFNFHNKNFSAFFCAFFLLALSVNAQQLNLKPIDADKMIPGMTEIMDPEVKVIQPGTDDGKAPAEIGRAHV